MSKQIKFLCLLITLYAFSLNSSAQEASLNNKNTISIEGKWEGNIVINEKKSIGILWSFKTTKEGSFNGYMGPVSKGVASIPMQKLTINKKTLSFTIQSQGSFSGEISKTGIKGIWSSVSGNKFTLYMVRELTKEHISQRYSKPSNSNKIDILQEIALGNIDAVKTFLSKGNNINSLYGKGTTLLFTAIKKDRTYKIAKYLLENGANPNLVTDGITPLIYAVAYQNPKIVKELIAHKADINFINKEKQSAIVFAIKSRNPEILQLLIDNGGDAGKKLNGNYSAIDLAKEENIKEILDVLNITYQGVSDGPYVTKSKNGHIATWVTKGKIHTQKISTKDSKSIEYKGAKANLWNKTPKEVKKLIYKGNFKIGAVSDIHGQYDTFIELLKNNGVINKQGNWSFGNGHFVVVGDMFDRGPQVTEVLWFLYDLEKQAAKKGGKLHVLLGNHDVMVLNGNLRSVHPKYNQIAKTLGVPFNTLFNTGTVLGDWLRSKPVLVKINDILFTHGGLHPDLVKKDLSIKKINKAFKKQLVMSELPEKRNDLGNFLHRKNGPIYYRGYFQGELATDKQLKELLKHFKISNIVVGHTTHRQIEMHYDGKVIVVDANMKSGTTGEMLLWQNGKFTRKNLMGKELPLNKIRNNK